MARLKSNLKKIAAQAPNSARRAGVRTARAILSTASQLAPVDQGELRDSYLKDSAVQEVPGQVFTLQLGSDVPHSVFNEFGTTRMEPRPHLTPAFAQSPETFKAILKEEVTNDF